MAKYIVIEKDLASGLEFVVYEIQSNMGVEAVAKARRHPLYNANLHRVYLKVGGQGDEDDAEGDKNR